MSYRAEFEATTPVGKRGRASAAESRRFKCLQLVASIAASSLGHAYLHHLRAL